MPTMNLTFASPSDASTLAANLQTYLRSQGLTGATVTGNSTTDSSGQSHCSLVVDYPEVANALEVLEQYRQQYQMSS